MLTSPWLSGHRFTLLENGEAFFPAVLEAIGGARETVLIETFIWNDDGIGRALRDALIDAARLGVRVEVCADAYGSPQLTDAFLEAPRSAGVRVRVFDPQPTVMGMRTNLFRRLHRKIAVIDDEVAFVGGINFEDWQKVEFSERSKRDYAVRVTGPVVAEIRAFCDAFVCGESPRAPRTSWWRRWRRAHGAGLQPPGADGVARFVYRDNERHRADIEQMYRAWIRAARDEIILANAYFFPGYRLLRQLRLAARRGVRVRLILQGMPDLKYAQLAARTLYEYLIASGVEIHEFTERPLHAKVAVIDGHRVTIGSSNLDPLSLWLNLEANLFVSDRELADDLRGRLIDTIEHQCRRVDYEQVRMPRWWRQVYRSVLFHLVRRFPGWAGLLATLGPRRQKLQLR
ncbi:MAG: cardiolipin synthase ClsB [Pseudomonadota bacterium]|nr:cardiolipin synthase ClsB [Pseudomonadota bacterium]